MRRDIAGNVEMTWEEWVSVVKLSLAWKIKHIEELALRKIPTRIQNSDEWVAALKVSTELGIQVIQKRAIRELRGKLTPLEMVELGTECGVADWLKQAYKTFATRTESISVEDEEKLGCARTSKLFRVRHRRIKKPNAWSLEEDIEHTFTSELADMTRVDRSPISYLQTDIHTVVDPRYMQRDDVYYFDDIVFLVSICKIILENLMVRIPAPGGTDAVQSSSLSVRAKFRYIPRHVSTSRGGRRIAGWFQ
jgi:hypothetical protein